MPVSPSPRWPTVGTALWNTASTSANRRTRPQTRGIGPIDSRSAALVQPGPDLAHLTPFQHPGQVELGGSGLHRVDQRPFDVGAVHEPVSHQVGHGPRLGLVLQHLAVAAIDDRPEGVDHLQIPSPTVDDPLVVVGHVPPGLDLPSPDQARFELVEV